MAASESAYELWWDSDARVAHCEWRPGSVCGLPEAMAITAEMKAFKRGAVPLLVDMRRLAKFERGAREFFSTDHGVVRAVALLVDSAVSKMMANFFIGIQRSQIPIRMFTDRAAALGWLAEHR